MRHALGDYWGLFDFARFTAPELDGDDEGVEFH